MAQDTHEAFVAFAKSYQEQFIAQVKAWDVKALEQLKDELLAARARGGTVFVAGNGGSAAVANHFECDASKGTHVEGHPPLATRSLSANPSMLTALGNDLGFEHVFEKQLLYFATPKDLVVLVSSSGNSPNVVKACEFAKAKGLRTVALVGFGGGKLKELADVALHVPLHNYGIVEDMHQACVHLVTQYLTHLQKG